MTPPAHRRSVRRGSATTWRCWKSFIVPRTDRLFVVAKAPSRISASSRRWTARRRSTEQNVRQGVERWHANRLQITRWEKNRKATAFGDEQHESLTAHAKQIRRPVAEARRRGRRLASPADQRA
jgi:hypothetical protein